MSEFCTGVQILLQRMETHPEEFYIEVEPNKIPRNAKWEHLMSNLVNVKKGGEVRGEAIFFTEAELDALFEGYAKIRRKAFDNYVMRRLLDVDGEEQDEGVTFTPNKPPRQILNVSTANQSLMQRQQAAAVRQLGLANAANVSNYPYGAISTGQTGVVSHVKHDDALNPGVIAKVKEALGF